MSQTTGFIAGVRGGIDGGRQTNERRRGMKVSIVGFMRNMMRSGCEEMVSEFLGNLKELRDEPNKHSEFFALYTFSDDADYQKRAAQAEASPAQDTPVICPVDGMHCDHAKVQVLCTRGKRHCQHDTGHQQVVINDAPALKCCDCQAKSANCAHGQLRGSQSCIDTIDRHQQART